MRTIDLREKKNNYQIAGLLHLSSIDNLYFSSQMEKESQAVYLKDLGVKQVIDLKFPEETEIDDKALWEKLGISYHAFPVGDVSKLSLNELGSFQKLIESSKESTLVYCMSSNRVAAIMALYLTKVCGHPKDRVIDLLGHMGMTKEALRESIVQRLMKSN